MAQHIPIFMTMGGAAKERVLQHAVEVQPVPPEVLVQLLPPEPNANNSLLWEAVDCHNADARGSSWGLCLTASVARFTAGGEWVLLLWIPHTSRMGTPP
jgi:hypothetical protein